MINVSQLEFTGFKGQNIIGTMHKHTPVSDRLAIIFPGYGYTCDRPLLHYSMQEMLNQGVDVLQVIYEFSNKPGFWQSGEETRAIWFGSDAKVAMRTVIDTGNYREFTLIGKSLGSLAIGHIATVMPELENARIIIFTPLLTNPKLVKQILEIKGKTLLVTGTNDSFHTPETLKSVRSGREMTIIEVEDGDHSLEVQGDIPRSLEVLNRIMKDVIKFLREPERQEI
ncbi:MAG: hypothetical protein HC806_01695 [Anaerolineae bacterium]|nr:hypothetical protein [Anaerolineae bacterium]